MKKITKKEKRKIRSRRIRARISGNDQCPRLCIFKSNKHIYASLIDDEKGIVLATANDKEIKEPKVKKSGKIDLSYNIGSLIAAKALKKNISSVVFDRSGYNYHGVVKSFAEGARKGGLKF